MDCRKCRDQFSAYLDGQLTPPELERFQEHLRTCEDCALDLADFQLAVTALGELPEVAPPARLLGQISAALDEVDAEAARKPRFAWRWSWQSAGALAVAACALFGFVAVLNRGPLSSGIVTPPAVSQQAPTAPAAPGTPPASVPEKPVTPSVAPEAPGTPAVLAGSSRVLPRTTARPRPRVSRLASREDRSPAPAATTTERDERGPVPPPPPAPVAEGGVPSAYADLLAGGGLNLGMKSVEIGAPALGASMAEAMVPAAPAPAVRTTRGGELARPFTLSAASMAPGAAKTIAPCVDLTDAADRDLLSVDLVPPRLREVGQPSVAALVITPSVDIPDAVVSVTPAGALEVTNAAERGVIYKGELPASRRTTVAVRMLPQTAGTQQMRIELRSQVPGASTDLDVRLPGYKAPALPALPQPEPTSTSADVNLVLHETELRAAIKAVSEQTGVRVDVAPEVGGQRVNYSFHDVPADAALRVLADEAGYRLTPEDGGFRVGKPQ
jgi:hypothetical protein